MVYHSINHDVPYCPQMIQTSPLAQGVLLLNVKNIIAFK